MNKKKLNVLLLNPPYKEPIIRDNYCCFTSKSQYIWPPIDLLYISGILRHADIAVSVIDAVIEKQSWEVVEKHVLKQKPDVIIMLTGTVSFQDDLEGLRSLVQKTKARSYVLGNTPAFKPLHFLRTYDFLTGIFHNFFDTRIRDEILEKSPSIESISTNKKGKHHIGKVNFLPHNHQLPLISPPQYDLFPLAKYTTPIAKRSPMATVLTGFGCPFTCKFCIASAIDFHPRQIKDLENEFDELQKKGVKEVFFEDSTFNKNETHLNMICNLLIGKNYQFTWSANIHSFNVTETNLRLMKKAGCHTVQIGVESGNQEILNQYAPSKRKEKIEDAFHLCKKVGQ